MPNAPPATTFPPMTRASTRAPRAGEAGAPATAAPDTTGRPAAAPAAAGTEAARSGGEPAGVVRVTVNGQARTLPAGHTLSDLLRAHDLDPRLVVVERNRVILRDRDAFATVVLADGDEIELVHCVGGG